MISEDDLLPYIRSANRQTQLDALKALKNSVIGHTEQKAFYLDQGVLDDLLGIINLQPEIYNDRLACECRAEAGIVLSSFAHSDLDIAACLLTPATIPTLARTLVSSSPPSLLLASLRTLTKLYTTFYSPSLSRDNPGLPRTISELIRHFTEEYMANPTHNTAQVLTLLGNLITLTAPPYSEALSQLSEFAVTPLQRLVLFLLLSEYRTCLLFRRERKLLSTSVLALSHVLTPHSVRQLCGNTNLTAALLDLLRDESSDVRIASAALITKFYTCMDSHVETSNPGAAAVTRAAYNEQYALALVPTLMKLLDDGLAHEDKVVIDPLVLHTLAIVCREGGKTADRCVEAGLISKVVSVVVQIAPYDFNPNVSTFENDSKILAGGLLCLAALGLHKEDNRKAIIDAGGLMAVVAVMNLENVPSVRDIKIAACNVLRTLSRSVVLLRATLVESGIVGGVVDLLGDSSSSSTTLSDDAIATSFDCSRFNNGQSGLGSGSWGATRSSNDGPVARSQIYESKEVEQQLEVRTAAMAAVCNLVLEFSPLRKPIIDKGILPLIVAGAKSNYAPLRVNAVWALKHMVCGDDMHTKGLVIDELGFPLLMRLCDDVEVDVQEQALDFIRNLVAGSEVFIDKLFAQVGVDRVFELIDRKLAISEIGYYESAEAGEERGRMQITKYQSNIIVCAIYILVNIAAGYENHRKTIMEHSSVLKRVIELMSHERDEVRLACLWVIVNITWAEDPLTMLLRDNEESSGGASGDVGMASFCDNPANGVYSQRALILQRLGVEEQLMKLRNDRVVNLREKAKTAIDQLHSLLGQPEETVGAGDDSFHMMEIG
ncbi:armadillo-type protein [Lipomyces oligophaga]|uniref:armadillo-type protein n=1 Tax=Lipomyces oligophaga TaxID=45792 RepID=UPI0034CDB5C7